MASQRIYTSKPDHWTLPRPHTDPVFRHYSHGPVQPMAEPSLGSRFSDFIGSVFSGRGV